MAHEHRSGFLSRPEHLYDVESSDECQLGRQLGERLDKLGQ